MSRRNGEVRSLGLNAKIGRGGTLTGDLRGRQGAIWGASGARQVVDLETSDAGALFRFTDVYSRMNGGQMQTVMDAPSASNPMQLGTVTVRNFAVHDEIAARTGGARRAAAAARTQQHRLFQHEGRLHPRAGTAVVARRRGARPRARRHDRRHDRLRPRRGASARHAGSALRRQQSARPASGGRPVPRRRQRKASSASPTRSSASRDRRSCTSTRSRRWRRACCAKCSNFRRTALCAAAGCR